MAGIENTAASSRLIKDVLNALLMLGVIIPPALITAHLWRVCPALALGDEALPAPSGASWAEVLERSLVQIQSEDGPGTALACELFLDQPLLLVNLLYFVVVDVGFYIIYLLQASTWLIDPHWQLIPMSIAAFWFTHPDSASNAAEAVSLASWAVHPRALLALVLVYAWGFRLLHNCEFTVDQKGIDNFQVRTNRSCRQVRHTYFKSTAA
jgi:hypothetical protein